MHTFGQNSPDKYGAQWKIVEELAGKGLAKSALEEVQKIYKLAKSEKEEAQVIKAAVNMIQLQINTREDHEVAVIKDLEAELAGSSEVAQAILKNLIAGAYKQYYQRIRWQLYRRSATTNFLKEDISTWGTEDFHNKISQLYLESLENEKLLQQTKLEEFDAIIVKGNVRKLRPTLFDLLAHNALNYFSSGEIDLKKPEKPFEISTASAFDPAADFIHRKFETQDPTSLEFYALKLYQRLIMFHINDAAPDALIDADLARLQYVRQKSVHENAEELYYISVNHMATQYQQTPAAAQAWYLVADFHFKRGLDYKTLADTNLRLEKVKAIAICERIIKENPETEGGVNAFNLLNTIRKMALQLSAELVVVPDKPFLLFIEYQNFTKLHLRIVKATAALKAALENSRSDATWRTISAATPVQSWTQDLPDTKDYQQHSIQIKADALPVGEYVLLASSNKNFSDMQSIGGARMLYVSNISYVQNESDYFVLNRDTGQPLAGAVIKRWEKILDSKTRIFKNTLKKRYVADKNGHFQDNAVSPYGEAQSASFEITFGNDQLHIEKSAATYYYDRYDDDDDDESVPDIYLFTDRSLYRPGQTVFFKGIAVEKKRLLKDRSKKITVVLENANGETVDSLTKTVNEFGSFSGSFILTGSGLNGSFSISANDKNAASFRVEEYKRPRFEVRFDTLRNTYKLGDTIRVTGAGTAYAGNQLTGAKVVYRVVRAERYMVPWTRRGRYMPTPPAKEMTHGETVTDEKGQFHVNFEAAPNLRANKQLDPVFDYTVYADVTDLNGETRSAETRISVGYKSFLIKTDIPEITPAATLTSLKIRTENMNGALIDSPVSVRIARLSPENRLIRPRYWERPDVFVMTKTEFISHFPHDEYDNETAMESWPEQEIVFENTQQISPSGIFKLEGKKFSPGFYKVAITAKNQNDIANDTIYIELIDPQNNKLSKPEHAWTKSGDAVEPGEKAELQIGTSAEYIFVISSSGKKSDQGNFSFFNLNNEKKNLSILAKEDDRGGYGVDYVFVKHNRIHQRQNFVNVPWTNKQLKIEYETFRDKTQPGSREEWKIKISGYQKEGVISEMLAGMYDASLDQFYPHQWDILDLWPEGNRLDEWPDVINFSSQNAEISNFSFSKYRSFDKEYDQLLNDVENSILTFKGGGMKKAPRRLRQNLSNAVQSAATGLEVTKDEDVLEESIAGGSQEELLDVVVTGYNPSKTPPPAKSENIVIRKNLNETAFFFPDIKTDKYGSLILKFTLPEALTRWKFQALAHTPDLAFGYSKKEIITQKELMVQPNAPRFLREGDTILFPAKIVNLSHNALNGEAVLQLFDPETDEEVSGIFGLSETQKMFSVPESGSTTLFFPLQIPKGYNRALTWRATAKAGNLSDGEENTLPVLPNRMLVTESLPMNLSRAGKKEFRFEKLLKSANSKTLAHESLTIEYTSNPVWNAVQALPYLMEYPYECAEQTWNRIHANALAGSIVKNTPKIAAVFQAWKTQHAAALESNLQKNPELKSLLLEETPWVLEAKSESEQKRNIALLFDLVKMSGEMESNMEKLAEMQNSTGGFPWFKGGQDDRYITQYILTGLGRLLKKNVIPRDQIRSKMLENAFAYLDETIKKDYEELIKSNTNLKEYIPGPAQIQYLFMLSCFDKMPADKTVLKAYQYFLDRTKTNWLTQTKLLQGQIALTLFRKGDNATAKAILKSLNETAIQQEEMGMYWKHTSGWHWFDAPIEQQALLIETFQEIEGDRATVDRLKTWLLKNKQTNRWESTKATADACYALLMTGSDWISDNTSPTIQIGNQVLKPESEAEAGSGYFKKTFESGKVSAEMGDIKIEINTKSTSVAPSWGAVYWQYFENLDKITFSETPLKLSKQLFIETKTDRGPVLEPVNENGALKVGDKVIVRIELRADRDMEYVHMKDARASTMEPVNVLSGYKWQGGLGYYETTKDVSTSFFFDRLRKGTYVFEYPLFVNHKGNFSNGITTIQCMYAPEFSANSEGIRIRVSED